MKIAVNEKNDFHKEISIRPGQNFDGNNATVLEDVGREVKFGSEIRVEAQITTAVDSGEGIKSIVSQWNPTARFESFEACHAGAFTDMKDSVFYGGVFDGRYIYYAPQYREGIYSANMVRYDTHRDFQNRNAWSNYAPQCGCAGFYGLVFDGQYVYCIPHWPEKEFIRYNTHLEFTSPGAWEKVENPSDICYQGGAFDGRYVYYVPGYVEKPDAEYSSKIRRFDSRGDFSDLSAWEDFAPERVDGMKVGNYDGAMFDGRYMYFIPLADGKALRYDTTRDFRRCESYEAYDAYKHNMRWNVGSVFDGQYLYFMAYTRGNIVRYNTAMAFGDDNAWEVFDAVSTLKNMKYFGYDGGIFDGRYVYFIPWVDGTVYANNKRNPDIQRHGEFLRFDAAGDFNDPASWSLTDISAVGGLATIGHNAGIFDGRHIYFAPVNNDTVIHLGTTHGHGNFLRYDTTGADAVFSLRFSDFGHNGGLGGAVPGPRFLVNTVNGAVSIAANRTLQAGKYKLTGSYDGCEIKLFINGQMVNSQPASGAINNSNVPICLGGICGGKGFFNGGIEEVRIANYI